MATTTEQAHEPVRDASITNEQADILAAKLDEQGFPRSDDYGRTLSLGLRLAMAVGLAGRYDAEPQEGIDADLHGVEGSLSWCLHRHANRPHDTDVLREGLVAVQHARSELHRLRAPRDDSSTPSQESRNDED